VILSDMFVVVAPFPRPCRGCKCQGMACRGSTLFCTRRPLPAPLFGLGHVTSYQPAWRRMHHGPATKTEETGMVMQLGMKATC